MRGNELARDIRATRGDESTYIPPGTRRRLEIQGMVPLEMIEVQSGACLGEDDSVHFEDRYRRG